MITATRLALATAATLALAACDGAGGGAAPTGDAVAKVAAPAGQSWSTTVRATQDGFVMGNPDAPLKLVEFASPTCSHCATFSTTGGAALKRDFVDSGRVSLEIRPFMLNPMDLPIATIAACGGTERFFPLMENLYASQAELLTGIQGADQAAAQAALQAQDFAAFARSIGLDRFFAARGVPADSVNSCLADKTKVVRWQQSTERAAQEHEVASTPSFLLNGELLENTHDWESVRAALTAAGAR